MIHSPIAGIDIGKNFSEMAVLAPSNKVYSRMKIHHDSCHDVNKAVQILANVEKDFGVKPAIVMESTGHYHKILFYFLTKRGYEVSTLNPIQTDSIKNVEIRKVKNDKVDARKIALLYRLQEVRPSNIPDAELECLRNLCRQYFNLSDDLTAYKNRLTGIIDQVMLNFTKAFKNPCCKTALAVLKKYPSPKHILNADPKELTTLIQKTSRRSMKWAQNKYMLLYTKAKEFAPLSIDSAANLTMIDIHISMINQLSQSLQNILSEINNLVEKDTHKEHFELLCTIPGVSALSAATILSEVNGFSMFSNPDKLSAYFGVDPSVRRSGQFEAAKNKMSKRGAKLLRRVLFTIAMVNISRKTNGKLNNPVLRKFYQNKCLSKPKMVALGAVMHKLVYIMFAVIRNKKPFELRTPEEHANMLRTRALTA